MQNPSPEEEKKAREYLKELWKANQDLVPHAILKPFEKIFKNHEDPLAEAINIHEHLLYALTMFEINEMPNFPGNSQPGDFTKIDDFLSAAIDVFKNKRRIYKSIAKGRS